MSFIAKDDALKQDALNTASAFLEASTLPVESFTAAEPLIESYLNRTYQGSVPGTFNTKKCIDLLNSNDLELLYEKQSAARLYSDEKNTSP